MKGCIDREFLSLELGARKTMNYFDVLADAWLKFRMRDLSVQGWSVHWHELLTDNLQASSPCLYQQCFESVEVSS